MLLKVNTSFKKFFVIEIPNSNNLSDSEINEQIKIIITKNMKPLLTNFDEIFNISKEELHNSMILQ